MTYFSSHMDFNISLLATPHKNITNINRSKFSVVKIIGRVFSLKLILYGTREDPLTNNSHVNRRMKRLTKFTKDQIKNRKKGQL